MSTVRHKRGTRAALVTLAASNGLIPDQIYLLSDEGNRVVTATSVNTFTEHLKLGEGSGGGSTVLLSSDYGAITTTATSTADYGGLV
jgi:hypothetical protein